MKCIKFSGILRQKIIIYLNKMTRPCNSQRKKRICQNVDFAIQADHRVKLKESEKRDKYQDLAREQKVWNMIATVIQIVIGELVTAT